MCIRDRYSLSPEPQWYATVLILIHNGCAMLLWPAAFTLPNALRAAGDVKVPMVISVCSMAVSYTHLDVYKRQPVWRCTP